MTVWRVGLALVMATWSLGCGEGVERVESSEVSFTEDGFERHFRNGQPIHRAPESEQDELYEFTVSDSETGDELTIGVASLEPGIYAGEEGTVKFDKQIESRRVSYVDFTTLREGCTKDVRIEIERQAYGMSVGDFSAGLCKEAEDLPGRWKIRLEGRFATSLAD